MVTTTSTCGGTPWFPHCDADRCVEFDRTPQPVVSRKSIRRTFRERGRSPARRGLVRTNGRCQRPDVLRPAGATRRGTGVRQRRTRRGADRRADRFGRCNRRRRHKPARTDRPGLRRPTLRGARPPPGQWHAGRVEVEPSRWTVDLGSGLGSVTGTPGRLSGDRRRSGRHHRTARGGDPAEAFGEAQPAARGERLGGHLDDGPRRQNHLHQSRR